MLDVSDGGDHWRVAFINDNAKVPDTYPPGAPKGARDTSYVERWRRWYKTFSKMPLRTQEAVAALSMCEAAEGIAGVGLKVSAIAFYVDSTPEIMEEYQDE